MILSLLNYQISSSTVDQNRLALLALHFIDGIGDYLIKQVISYTGSAEKAFKTPKGKLMQIPGVGEVTAEAILNGKPFQEAEKELRRAEKESVELVFYMDKKYPSRLKSIPVATLSACARHGRV